MRPSAKVADYVEPVPEALLRRDLTPAEVDATKRGFRADTRMRAQQSEVLKLILNSDPERTEGGRVVVEPLRRGGTVQRPTSATITPRRPASATASLRGRQHAHEQSGPTTPRNPLTLRTPPPDPEAPVNVPTELEPFHFLAKERNRLLREGKAEEAASLVHSRVASKSTTPRPPSRPMSSRPHSSSRREGADAGTTSTGGARVHALSISERIGVLHSGCCARSLAREQRMEPMQSRRTYCSGPDPVPPVSERMKRNAHSGVAGVDMAMSHFIDANDFDDSEQVFSPADEGPSSMGFSRFYTSTAAASSGSSDGKGDKVKEATGFVMEPCKILKYDHESGSYIIRWVKSGATKVVRPLNLQFHHETTAAFEARMRRAEAWRDAAEAEMRLAQVVDIADAIEEPLPLIDTVLERILQRTAVVIPKEFVTLMQSCIDEVEAHWRHALRRATLMYRLKNREERERLADLRIPMPPPQQPELSFRDLRGTLSVVDPPPRSRRDANESIVGCTHASAASPSPPPSFGRREFALRRRFLSEELFAAHPSLRACELYAVNRWSLFDGALLVEVSLDQLKPPLGLVDFSLLQVRHNERVSAALHVEWISSIASHMQSELSHTFNFYEESVERFERSRMARFLRRINLCLSGQLQGLVYDSIAALHRFLATLSVKDTLLQAAMDEHAVGGRSSGAFLEIVGCLGVEQIIPPAMRVAEAIPVPREPFAIDGASVAIPGVIYGFDSLLVTQLVINADGRIDFEPTLESIEERFIMMFDSIFQSTDHVVSLGRQLFPLLDIEEIPLTAAAQLLRPADERINACKQTLSTVLESNLLLARALRKLYEPFHYIEAISLDQLLADFQDSDTHGPAGLADYDHVCARLASHITRIRDCSLNEVSVPLLRMECGELKQHLIAKASKLQTAMLRHLISRTNAEIDAACDEYRYIHDRVQFEPGSPEELKELREFVDGVPVLMEQLDRTFDGISDSVQLLGKYGFMPDQAAFEKFWTSYSWPRKISIIMDDAPFRLQMYRSQFLNQLHANVDSIHQEVQETTRAINLFSFEDDENQADVNWAQAVKLEKQLTLLKERAALFNQHEAIFQQPQTKFVQLRDADKAFQPFAQLWKVALDSRHLDLWLDTPLEKLKADDVVSAHAAWSKEVARLSKLLANEAPVVVAKSVKERLDAYKPNLPLIVALAKPSLYNRKRHVNKVAELCGESTRRFELRDRTMLDVLRMGAGSHIPAIQELSENADHEYKLEYALGKMRDEWQRVSLSLTPYRDTYLLKDTDEIRNMIDEHLMKTQAMVASPYASAIMNELKPWEEKLLRMSATIDAWLQCQFGFHYLDPIFLSRDIVSSMPEEARQFEQVHLMWAATMESVLKVPNAIARCSEEKLLGIFHDSNAKLDRILRELQKFLDTKRVAFPRFYFLSNEDLIEILSEAKDPTLVQPHLKKCFEGISKLVFTDQGAITDMTSTEGEVVKLSNAVVPSEVDNVVEKWLSKVEAEMMKTVATHITEAVSDYAVRPRTEWVLRWPGQVAICASQIHWTMLVERSILEDRLDECAALVRKQLEDLVMLVRGNLSPVHLCTLQALVVLEVHARDITTMLAEKYVGSVDAFDWQAQLRYYTEKGSTLVRQTVAQLPYGNEYLGNTGRLVITPLTDRCYRTLTSAHHLHYGGAPEGPAGTGKTETTKDLAKAIAKQCVVFNCSDQIKAFEMEKLLRGIASSGAWGCFDEFNRIEVQVLSVIAQQVLSIQIAVTERRLEFLFEGKMCSLRRGCSVFVTMNPGYAGRAELPENLKALFRPIAMMVPDYALIAENSLYSGGFLQATSLSKKIVATYKLCSEQLSSQSHYDYGMRAVKAVLTAAQNLRRGVLRDASEMEVVLRAIRDVNIPKFLISDAKLFEGIISDLFGDTSSGEPDYAALDEGIAAAASELALQVTPFFMLKMKQVYDMVRVRHGIMVVGLSMSGKTACLRCLARGLSWAKDRWKVCERTHLHTMNPKSVTMSQLYGFGDASGTDWNDGILSNIFRQCASDLRPERQWLVLDGPVDALWIENMNTVLDDNKKLCLTNGDIIRMTEWMTMVFCVRDLEAASPATVSRCGMIYFEPKELGVQPLIDSWLQQLPLAFREQKPVVAQVIQDMLKAITGALGDLLKQHLRLGVPLSENVIVAQLLRFLGVMLRHHLLPPEDDTQGGLLETTSDLDLTMYAEGIFCFALVWAVGALAGGVDARAVFDAWLRRSIDPDSRNRNALYRPVLPLPEHESIFSFNLVIPTELSGEPRWVGWMNLVPEVPIESQLDLPYHSIIVPTPDSTCYKFLVEILIKSRAPVLLTGDTGTGKTLVFKTIMLKELDRASYANCFIQFSAQTTAGNLKSVVESRIDRRSGRKYGPPVGKHLLVFVDDLGMPEADQYGSQPPIELLRQFCSSGGWYSTSKGDVAFKEIINTVIVGAMQPADAGRPAVTSRLLRHFHNMFLPPHSQHSLQAIFQKLMDHIIFQPGMNVGLRSARDGVVAFGVGVFEAVSKGLLPTPATSHYTFNLRDLCQVFQGVADIHAPTTRDELSLITLVCHECLRVFGDRLTCAKDREKLEAIMKQQLAAHLRVPYDAVVPTPQLLFTNFVASADDRMYVRVDDDEAARRSVERYLAQYNGDMISRGGQMNLVVFDYVVSHVARVARIIQQPMGSALLVGFGGCGRRSVAKLAASIAGYSLRTIKAAAKYSRDLWRDDLSVALRDAGEKGIATAFLLTDSEVTDESFFEDICNVLNTGEVPGLFNADSTDQITAALRPIAKELGKDFDRDGCWEHFLSRVRINLHFILCFSPAGELMRVRLRRFPALMNCATIDWFDPWPEDGLHHVAASRLAESLIVPDELLNGVSNVMLKMHRDAEQAAALGFATRTQPIDTTITPTNFLDLLAHFKRLHNEKREELTQQRTRYERGLQTMRQTQLDVSAMQALLERNQPVLLEKAENMAVLIKEIDEQTAEADKERALVAIEEAQANKIASEARAVKEECEANLNVAMPALNAATAAVSQIDKRQLVEIKAMQNPPARVRKVMEAICVVFEVPPREVKDPHSNKREYDYWTPTKSKVMADVEAFRDSLVNFDKENMKPEIFENKLLPYIKDRNFKPEAVRDVSQALVGVCQWVIAMETYYRVFKIVKPKKARLAAAEEELRAATEVLDTKKAKLAAISAKLAALRSQLDDGVAERGRLESEHRLTQVKLERAVKLLSGLSNEKLRYESQVADLTQRLETLLGDCLLSAGFCVYLGMFSNTKRRELMTEWTRRTAVEGITIGNDFSLQNFLSSAVEVLQWRVNGLPSDQFSVDGAVIVHRGCKFPYIVDPQSQANMWIKAVERDHGNLFVLRPADKGYEQQLIHAVQHGYPVLLEDCDEAVDPFLTPLLLRQTVEYDGKEVITLGDATVPYHPGFRLYMTTRIAKPRILPETSTKVCVVAFFITSDGLAEQVLQRTIQHEERDQEEKKNRFIEQQASSRRQLKEIEDTILAMISGGDDLLATDDVNKHLDNSRHTSTVLGQRLEEIEQFQHSFEKVRTRYAPLAADASVIFSVTQSLSSIEPVYQFSLQWYFSLLQHALGTERVEEQSKEERVNALIVAFHQTVFVNVTRALFAKDHLVFSFLFVARLADVPPKELLFFVTGGASAPHSGRTSHPQRPSWLLPEDWDCVCSATDQLSSQAFGHFSADVAADESGRFHAFASQNESTMPPLPSLYESRLSAMQRLIVVRCLSRERLVHAISQFVAESHGTRFLQPPVLRLDEVLEEVKSDAATPLVFLLSSGADPVTMVRRLAEKNHMTDQLDTLSLGQGMGECARQMIHNAKRKGRWVMLQNMHLYKDWMPQLDRLVEELMLNRKEVSIDFRLWLTTLPTSHIPVTLLERSLKMVVEPPSGIKSNLLKSYSAYPLTDQAFFEENASPEQWKSLCFALCLFHAVVQERRAFGALGWNVPYEFNDTDLSISLRQLHLFVNRAAMSRTSERQHSLSDSLSPSSSTRPQAGGDPDIAFDALQYLIGECNYGGRVTDAHDRTLLRELLLEFVAPRSTRTAVQFDPESTDFPMPPIGTVEDYQSSIISRIPANASPSLFGLHQNATITRDRRQAVLLMDAVAATLPRDDAPTAQASSDAATAAATEPHAVDSRQQVIAVAAAFLEQLRDVYDMDEVTRTRPVSYTDSMNTILHQELQRFNRLITRVRGTLRALVRSLRGEIVLSNELDGMAADVAFGRVPVLWVPVSYPSLKPLAAYMADLLRRLETFDRWIACGPAPVHWLGGFFFPHSFITGVMQNFSRGSKLTIDSLKWDVKVLRDEDPATVVRPPTSGCYVTGLHLEGAGWNARTGELVESTPGVLHVQFPVLWMLPVSLHSEGAAGGSAPVEGHAPASPSGVKAPRGRDLDGPMLSGDPFMRPPCDAADAFGRYLCPVYRTSQRRGVLMTTGHSTNFIIHFPLPCAPGTGPEHWVKRGVALLTALDT